MVSEVHAVILRFDNAYTIWEMLAVRRMPVPPP